MLRSLTFCCILTSLLAVAALAHAQEPGANWPNRGPWDWEKHPYPAKKVAVTDVSFADEKLESTLLRWQSAASALHRKDWFHQDWYEDPHQRFGAVNWWSTTPKWTDFTGRLLVHQTPKSKVHSVAIRYHASDVKLKADAVGLLAIWQPDESWGAELHYLLTKRQSESTYIKFVRRGLEESDIDFYPGLGTWQRKQKFGQVTYQFLLAAPSVHDSPSATQWRDWYASPEKFRDGSLKLLDDLAGYGREQIPAGKACFATIYRPETGSSAEPARDEPIKPPMNKAVMDEALAELLKEVDTRRAWVNENYKPLHQALVHTFPVEALLGEEKRVDP